MVCLLGSLPLTGLVQRFVFAGYFAAYETGGVSVGNYHLVGAMYVCPTMSVGDRKMSVWTDWYVLDVDT